MVMVKSFSTRDCILQVCLKIADISHLATSLPVHRRWLSLLEEEYFQQGDQEKLNKLAVSSLMDRNKPGICKPDAQISFYEVVAIPMFQQYAKLYPAIQQLHEALEDNYAHWRNLDRSNLDRSATDMILEDPSRTSPLSGDVRDVVGDPPSRTSPLT